MQENLRKFEILIRNKLRKMVFVAILLTNLEKNHPILSQNLMKLLSFVTELKTMMDFTLFDTNPMILAQFI